MNPNKNSSTMHFKSAQIQGLEIGPSDLAQINQYSLSPLSADEVFAFKVSMAGNEIDRDYEVFPRATLSKLASLFMGKTVLKDHDHRSDNQISRIYATELVDGHHMQRTKSGEIYSELIAKCYMIKTSTNADLIAEIRAGIRKEVSLGCSIGKAVCSICDTDNVKTYCTHFGGKRYDGKMCFFSLEEPNDAYELSFVAIPAQQHAGTVKSYGEKPCFKAEMDARAKAAEKEQEEESAENHIAEQAFSDDENRLTVNRFEAASTSQLVQKSSEQAANGPESAPLCPNCARYLRELAATEAEKSASKAAQDAQLEPECAEPENLHTRESASHEGKPCQEKSQQSESGDEPQNRLTVNQVDDEADSDGADPDTSSGAENEVEDEGDTSPGDPAKEQAELKAAPSGDPKGDQAPPESDDAANQEEIAEAEKAMKAKEAQARLRALNLAISLRQHTKIGGNMN